MQQEEIKESKENISYNLTNPKNYFSKMTEEETNIWLKQLNLDEKILNEIEQIVKNGKDLISLYNNSKILEKLNIDLHSNNILNDAIEEALEEQLKINIEIEKDKNIIINIENEPKYKLKEIYADLEKLLKKKVFLCPKNNPNEILNPNTLIHKKILLNPNKYCNLCLFNESIITPITPNPVKENLNTANNINTMNNIKTTTNITNTNMKKDSNFIQLSDISKLNNDKKDINKGYTSLFQNKKKNAIPDFTTDYQMPSHNKSNDNINTNINSNNDFKYQNILINKDKEKDNKFNLNVDNNTNNINNTNNEPKKDYTNFNIINTIDTNLNKNYLTQRNFNTKNFSLKDNVDNGDIFSKVTNFKIMDRTKNINNNNNTNLNNNEKSLESNNNQNMNNNNNNKAESRYEFVKYQDIDIFKNKNVFNMPQAQQNTNEINDINNLIIKTQTPNINKPTNNQIKKEDSDDILKSLREKYSLQNKNNGNDMKEMNLEYKKDYKPKTPIAEGRRTFNNDNMKYNFNEENSNDPLENKFLNINQNRTTKKEDFDQYDFMNKNKINMFNINSNEQNEQQNNGFGGMGKMRTNRPSPGLDFNTFQYKTTGYKSSFGQNMEMDGDGEELNEDMNNI